MSAETVDTRDSKIVKLLKLSWCHTQTHTHSSARIQHKHTYTNTHTHTHALESTSSPSLSLSLFLYEHTHTHTHTSTYPVSERGKRLKLCLGEHAVAVRVGRCERPEHPRRLLQGIQKDVRLNKRLSPRRQGLTRDISG